MEEYIIQKSKEIISKHFDIEVEVELDKYKDYIDEKRKKEINKYRKYDVVSPQIYNICYFILTKEKNMYKDKVKNKLQEEVDGIKREIRTIQILGYTPSEYKSEKEKEQIFTKNCKPKIDGIDWDIPEYEIIRGDWNSTRV